MRSLQEMAEANAGMMSQLSFPSGERAGMDCLVAAELDFDMDSHGLAYRLAELLAESESA